MDVGRCFKDAWQLLRKDLGPIALIAIATAVMVSVAGSAGPVLWDLMLADDYGTDLGWEALAFPAVITLAVAALVETWALGSLLRIMLGRAREGRAARYRDLRSGFKGYGSFLVAIVALAALIGLGFAAFIVPGVVLATAWCYVPVLIVDGRRGLGEALSRSREVAKRPGFGMTLLTLMLGSLMVGVASAASAILVFVPLVGQLVTVAFGVYVVAYLVAMYFQATGEAALLDRALYGAARPGAPAGDSTTLPAGSRPVSPVSMASFAAETPGGRTPTSSTSAVGAEDGVMSSMGSPGERAPRTIVRGFGDVTDTPLTAVVGLACGACALVASVFMFGIFLIPVPAALAIALGVVGLVQAYLRGAPKGLALAAIVCGIAAAGIVWALMYVMGGWA